MIHIKKIFVFSFMVFILAGCTSSGNSLDTSKVEVSGSVGYEYKTSM